MDKHDEPGVNETSPSAGEDTTVPLAHLLREPSMKHAAPDALRAKVRASLAQAATDAAASDAAKAPAIESPTAPSPPSRQPDRARQSVVGTPGWAQSLAPWMFGGTAGALLGGLAVAAALLVARPPATPAGGVPANAMALVSSEIVGSHVRALLSQRPIDVISTDRHTVKPWFNGRLDYAPPVIDLAGKGFPLTGGRLDYVAHRSVAVLVYRTDRHPIDLYVYPAADKGVQAPMYNSVDGYAMVRWQRDGMVWWAITDAEMTHLRDFAQLLMNVPAS